MDEPTGQDGGEEEHSSEDEGQDVDGTAEEVDGHENVQDVISVSGMYKDWFLDYASYVILERAVPALADGLKPVQRRILHSMKDLDDGRYNKVANIIGHTMKYHPHGDASIGDALVQVGQKDLLIDTQGNWGNTLTGDGAAAPRYIEARLSKFALEVVFNPKTTNWQASYDGRNKEPMFLPVKFPLLLAQGGEGIAVGLACKLLPHNFIELIDGSIAILKGKRTNIMPDFLNGGTADFTNYNGGLRGGKVRLRARIRQEDKTRLVIHEIPWGTTTSSLIDSIVKANDKGKIKIKKIEDNTAAHAEIVINLPAGISPDKTIDALYAFSDCEVSISPNACVIENDKPRFVDANTMLKISTDHTVELLKLELEIRKGELEEQWHFASLEKIFIEKRIYRDIEEAETWEEVLGNIDKGLKPHIKKLKRAVTEADLIRLTEIRIKRISKFDSFKADEHITGLEDKLAEVRKNLDALIEFAIAFFKELKRKYGAGRERKTEIKTFDTIVAAKVIVANKKLYVDREEGFIGWGIRKEEYLADCSDIDDIVVFRKDGVMQVTKIADKKFVGKDILFAGVWKKGDARTIYHMIYQDGSAGPAYMKRFNVTSITRDKEYHMTRGSKGSRVLYFSANPNGTSETLHVQLRPRPKLKKLKFDVDMSELAIKGRGVKGNLLTKNLISKITQKEVGASTLGARKIWYDDVVNRLNAESRGELLGEFKGDDKILTIMGSGQYKLLPYALSSRFEEDLVHICKLDPEKPMTVIYYDGEKELYYVKRFLVESSSKPVLFINEHEKSFMEMFTLQPQPRIKIEFDKRSGDRPDEEIGLEEFISVKGLKAQGNRLTTHKVKNIELLEPLEPIAEEMPEVEEIEEAMIAKEEGVAEEPTVVIVEKSEAISDPNGSVSKEVEEHREGVIKPKKKAVKTVEDEDGQITLDL